MANGVVFAVSSGEFMRRVKDNGQLYTAEERIALSNGNVTLFAFDAATNKELFSSGRIMTSFTHLGGVAVSGKRVYTSTHDSTVTRLDSGMTSTQF